MAVSAFQKVLNRLFREFALRNGREPQTAKEWMDLQNEAVQFFNKTKGVPAGPRKPPFQGWKPEVIQGGKGIESLLKSGDVKKGVAPKTTKETLKAKKDKHILLRDSEEGIARIKSENKQAIKDFKKKHGTKTVEDFRDEGDWDPSGMASGGRIGLAGGGALFKFIEKLFIKASNDIRLGRGKWKGLDQKQIAVQHDNLTKKVTEFQKTGNTEGLEVYFDVNPHEAFAAAKTKVKKTKIPKDIRDDFDKNILGKKVDKDRLATADELEEYESILDPTGVTGDVGEGMTVKELDKMVADHKSYERYMYDQYKTGKLDKYMSMEAKGARVRSADDAGRPSGYSPDEEYEIRSAMDEAENLAVEKYENALELEKAKKSPWFKDSKTLTPEEELRREFPGIDDRMIKNILADKNPQRIAEAKQTMREALKMGEKGMSPDEIIRILEDTTRTKQASGGLAYMLGEPTYMKAGGGHVGHGPWTTGQVQQQQQPQQQQQAPRHHAQGQPNPMKMPQGIPSAAPRSMDPRVMQQQMMQRAMMGQGQQPRRRAAEGRFIDSVGIGPLNINPRIGILETEEGIGPDVEKKTGSSNIGADIMLDIGKGIYGKAEYDKGRTSEDIYFEGEKVLENVPFDDDIWKFGGGYEKDGTRAEVVYDPENERYEFKLVKSFNQGGRVPMTKGGATIPMNTLALIEMFMGEGMSHSEAVNAAESHTSMFGKADGGRIGMMYGGDPGFAFEYGGSWADWHDSHRNQMPVEDYIQTKLPKERLPFRDSAQTGGRIGFGLGGINKARRAFLKMMAGITGAGIAGGTGLLKLSKAAKVAPKVTEEVITRGADGMPKYIYDLIEVVKAKGTRDVIEGFKRSDYSTVHSYKGVDVIEDAGGNIRIKKPTEGVATDASTGKMHEGTSQEVHIEINKGGVGVKDEGLETQKTFQEPDEYFEGTVRPDMDGKMKDFEEGIDELDHLDLKKIADEIGDVYYEDVNITGKLKRPKKASGGLAHMLGE